jgi:hypothetical protein
LNYPTVQGIASGAGKTLLVTAPCRLFSDARFRAAPHTAQNMFLKSWASPDGREMYRAQWLQSRATSTPRRAEMNHMMPPTLARIAGQWRRHAHRPVSGSEHMGPLASRERPRVGKR